MVYKMEKIDGNLKINQSFIQRAFMNIIDNAIEHGKEGSIIKIAIKCKEKNYAVIILNEENVYEDRQENVEAMDGCVRSTRQQKHYGIGLSYAKKMVEIHGGCLKLEKERNYKKVEVTLPIFD